MSDFPQNPRPLESNTRLDGRVKVSIPDGHDALLSLPWARKLEAVAVDLDVVSPGESAKTTLRTCEDPIIVIGNLADSTVVRELYYDFNCATDRWYPGPGGYELRTLIDPYGTGSNRLHIGYSDDAGRDRALELFADEIAEKLAYQNQIHATRLPIPPHEADRIAKSDTPSLLWQYGQSDSLNKGYLGYLTGDQSQLSVFNKTLAGIIEYGIPEGDHHIKDLHIRMHHIFNIYRLLENAGLIEERLREPMLAFVFAWTVSSEHGLSCIQEWRYQALGFPRQNHGLLPALAFTYFADYVDRYFPGVPDTKIWRENAERVYGEYFNGSWKPLCDGLCHGWYLSQPAMLEYGLIDPERRYFESGGARKAAEAAIAGVNNRGWMPSAGDSNIFRIFPGATLRTAAAYYHEPLFWSVHQRSPQYRSMKYHAFLPRAFDTGLNAETPSVGLGIQVVPMDPIVYHVVDRHPDAPGAESFTAPHAPIEQCFDKISVRTGWEEDADYLLVDGLGGGSHAFEDALGILDYERRGLSLVVQEDGSSWSDPEHHSLLTIVRDGFMGRIPSFGEVIRTETTEEHYYLALRLSDYSGADWTREIWLVRDAYLVVHDTVIAREAGDFAIEAHFRIPGRVELQGGLVTGPRHSFEDEAVEFRLIGVSNTSTQTTCTTIPHPRFVPNPGEATPEYPEEDRMEAWRRRYHLDEATLGHYTMRSAGPLEEGALVSITHVVQGRWPEEAPAEVEVVDRAIRVTVGGSRRSFEPTMQDAARPISSGHTASGPTAPSVFVSEDLFETVSKIVDFVIAGDQLIWGTDQGEIGCFDLSTGSDRWRVNVGESIHALGVAGTGHIAAGVGDHELVCLDPGGSVQWRCEIEREPTSCPWWELYHPSAVSVQGNPNSSLDQRGREEAAFMVGCGDLLVRGFDLEGVEAWRCLYENGVPARMTPIALPARTRAVTIVGGEIKSNQSTARFLNFSGDLVLEIPVEGWTSLLTAVDSTIIGDAVIVAFGSTRGQNLRVYDVASDGGSMVERFSHRLGGHVAGVLFVRRGDGGVIIVSATTQGALNAFDRDGNPLWHALYPLGLEALVPFGGNILVVERGGTGHVLDVDGDGSATESLGADLNKIIEYDGKLLVADGVTMRSLSMRARC